MPSFRLYKIEEDFLVDRTGFPIERGSWFDIQERVMPKHDDIPVAQITRIYGVSNLHRGLGESSMIYALTLEVGDSFVAHAGKTVTRLQ